jgi:hypothetical protein
MVTEIICRSTRPAWLRPACEEVVRQVSRIYPFSHPNYGELWPDMAGKLTGKIRVHIQKEFISDLNGFL